MESFTPVLSTLGGVIIGIGFLDLGDETGSISDG